MNITDLAAEVAGEINSWYCDRNRKGKRIPLEIIQSAIEKVLERVDSGYGQESEVSGTTMITKALIEKIDGHKKQIAKHRDALREILDEVESVEQSSTEGIEDLDSAIEKLSQFL